MGYACPVCEAPQADGEHLANHLAFTALLHEDDHMAWLDDHAPDWQDRQPAELAAVVTDHATEEDYPQVFEDTTDGDDHGMGADGTAESADVPEAAPDVQSAADDVVQEILEEARDLTREAADRQETSNADEDEDENGAEADPNEHGE